LYTSNPHLQRGEMLFSQGRLDLAEKELRQAIAAEPNDGTAYSYLAICLANREQWQEATETAQRGVGLDPDSAYAHYALASVLQDRNMYPQARASVAEALRLDPHRPAYWAMRGHLDLQQNRNKDAVEAAERGLELDPEDESCINVRAIALTNLGKRAEAGAAIAESLANNPLNAQTHANMGWTLLHQGKPKEASEHFREALRLKPDLEWARAGIAEAMKARNPVYRLFLAYFLFMARIPSNVQWGILIGGYIGYRVLNSVAKNNPSLSPYLTPLVVAYFAFAIGTIVAIPLFNLLLLTDRFGRHTLSTSQKVGAGVFGFMLLPPIAMLVLWAQVGGPEYELGSLLFGTLLIPVALAGLAGEGRARVVMWAIAAVLTLTATGLTWWAVTQGKTNSNWVMMHAIGCLGSTWIANILSSTSKPRVRG
jgi:tetratricopeptide (TPR) repeat protein